MHKAIRNSNNNIPPEIPNSQHFNIPYSSNNENPQQEPMKYTQPLYNNHNPSFVNHNQNPHDYPINYNPLESFQPLGNTVHQVDHPWLLINDNEYNHHPHSPPNETLHNVKSIEGQLFSLMPKNRVLTPALLIEDDFGQTGIYGIDGYDDHDDKFSPSHLIQNYDEIRNNLHTLHLDLNADNTTKRPNIIHSNVEDQNKYIIPEPMILTQDVVHNNNGDLILDEYNPKKSNSRYLLGDSKNESEYIPYSYSVSTHPQQDVDLYHTFINEKLSKVHENMKKNHAQRIQVKNMNSLGDQKVNLVNEKKDQTPNMADEKRDQNFNNTSENQGQTPNAVGQIPNSVDEKQGQTINSSGTNSARRTNTIPAKQDQKVNMANEKGNQSLSIPNQKTEIGNENRLTVPNTEMNNLNFSNNFFQEFDNLSNNMESKIQMHIQTAAKNLKPHNSKESYAHAKTAEITFKKFINKSKSFQTDDLRIKHDDTNSTSYQMSINTIKPSSSASTRAYYTKESTINEQKGNEFMSNSANLNMISESKSDNKVMNRDGDNNNHEMENGQVQIEKYQSKEGSQKGKIPEKSKNCPSRKKKPGKEIALHSPNNQIPFIYNKKPPNNSSQTPDTFEDYGIYQAILTSKKIDSTKSEYTGDKDMLEDHQPAQQQQPSNSFPVSVSKIIGLKSLNETYNQTLGSSTCADVIGKRHADDEYSSDKLFIDKSLESQSIKKEGFLPEFESKPGGGDISPIARYAPDNKKSPTMNHQSKFGKSATYTNKVYANLKEINRKLKQRGSSKKATGLELISPNDNKSIYYFQKENHIALPNSVINKPDNSIAKSTHNNTVNHQEKHQYLDEFVLKDAKDSRLTTTTKLTILDNSLSLGQKQDMDRINAKNSENIKEQINSITHECIQLLANKDYSNALSKLQECLRVTKLYYSAQHPHYLHMHLLLADCLYKLSKIQEAEKLIENLLKKYEAEVSILESKQDDKFVHYYFLLHDLLGRIKLKRNLPSEAREIFKKIIENLEILSKEWEQSKQGNMNKISTLQDINMMRLNLAESYKQLGDIEEAKRIYFSVLNTLDGIEYNHDDDYRKAEILYRLGESIEKLGYVKEAMKLYIRYYKAIENTDGDNEFIQFKIIFFDKLAIMLYKQQRIPEAIKLYERSLILQSETLGQYHHKVGLTLLALGKLYILTKDYKEAESKLSHGISILEQLKGKNTIYSANVYMVLGQLNYINKDYTQAVYYYEKSLEIYSILFGKNDIYCYRIYLNIMYICFISNSLNKLKHILEQLIKILDRFKDLNTMVVYNEIGNLHRRFDLPREAITFYNKALTSYKYSNSHQDLIYIIYCNIGSTYYIIHEYGNSLDYYREAQKYYEKFNLGLNNGKYAQILMNIGKIYKAMSKTAEATNYIKKAMELMAMLNRKKKIKNIEII